VWTELQGRLDATARACGRANRPMGAGPAAAGGRGPAATALTATALWTAPRRPGRFA
jgi:hypothetical protein